MVEMSASEDRQWAIPNSDFSSGIHVFPKHESEVGDAGIGFDRPFAGLRYAALTARGSAGTRAEHITDLLNFSRRTHANKVDTALRLRAWLTRTRLCWQRKKNDTQTPQSGRTPAFGVRQAPG